MIRFDVSDVILKILHVIPNEAECLQIRFPYYKKRMLNVAKMLVLIQFCLIYFRTVKQEMSFSSGSKRDPICNSTILHWW